MIILSASSASSGGRLIEEKAEVGQHAGKEHGRGSGEDPGNEDKEDGVSVHGGEVRINTFRIPEPTASSRVPTDPGAGTARRRESGPAEEVWALLFPLTGQCT